jgi:prefoldin beta subunit
MVNGMDKETEQQIKELQILEQNMQNILMQKQAFQAELSEVENASQELQKAGEEVYKITGNVMIKVSKTEILKDVKEKKELLSLRLKTLDNQEKSLEGASENLRKKVLSKIKKE